MAVATQSTKVQTIAAEALLTAADTVERWVNNEREHYEGTDDSAIITDRQTFNRAFNAAYDYNVEADTSGDKFDAVENKFSKSMQEALSNELSGLEAAEYYRQHAKEMVQ